MWGRMKNRKKTLEEHKKSGKPEDLEIIFIYTIYTACICLVCKYMPVYRLVRYRPWRESDLWMGQIVEAPGYRLTMDRTGYKVRLNCIKWSSLGTSTKSSQKVTQNCEKCLFLSGFVVVYLPTPPYGHATIRQQLAAWLGARVLET